MDLKQLEIEAQKLIAQTANEPFLFQLGPQNGRIELDKAQAGLGPIPRPEVDIDDCTLPGGPRGPVSVRIIKPKHAGSAPLPVIVYIHGAGWVFVFNIVNTDRRY